MSHLNVVKQNPRETVLQTTCPDCGIVDEFTVSSASLQMWTRGDRIQDAFPELDEHKREKMYWRAVKSVRERGTGFGKR